MALKESSIDQDAEAQADPAKLMRDQFQALTKQILYQFQPLSKQILAQFQAQGLLAVDRDIAEFDNNRNESLQRILNYFLIRAIEEHEERKYNVRYNVIYIIIFLLFSCQSSLGSATDMKHIVIFITVIHLISGDIEINPGPRFHARDLRKKPKLSDLYRIFTQSRAAHRYITIGVALDVPVSDLIIDPTHTENNLRLVFERWIQKNEDVTWGRIVTVCDDYELGLVREAISEFLSSHRSTIISKESINKDAIIKILFTLFMFTFLLLMFTLRLLYSYYPGSEPDCSKCQTPDSFTCPIVPSQFC